ncbi:MAG TPA: diguanylate cyclase [Gammaproteobacteria bacterium]
MITNAYQATHDALTDLPNDFLFLDRLSRAVATSERDTNRFALLFIVLDNYKSIHQEYGKKISDQLLLQITERLKVSLREADTLARTGDNRFAVLLTQIKNRNVITQLIRRVEKTLAETFLMDAPPLHINASIAYGIYPDNAVDAMTLIQYVEDELCNTKQSSP